MRTAIPCAILLILLPAEKSVFAQRPKLTWAALDAKKPFYVEMTHTATQALTVADMENKQRQEQTTWYHWTPHGKKNGKYEVTQKTLAIKGKIDIGGNAIPYFSYGKKRFCPTTSFFDALVGTELTLVIDPKTMAIAKVKGKKRLLAKLTKRFPNHGELYKSILSQPDGKFFGIDILGFYPPRGIVPNGQRWTKTDRIDIGSLGGFDITYRYRYRGKKDRLHRIDFTCDMKLAPPKRFCNRLPFVVQSVKLKWKRCGGHILFDADKGRLAEFHMTMDMDGDLSVEIGGQTTCVALHQTQVMTIRMTSEPTLKIGSR